MKKIPTIFRRDPLNLKAILNEPNPSCAWVFDGEGVATRKYDGTCCLVQGGKLYKRREIKKGNPVPPDFMQADYDEVTGKTVGWVPVDENNAEDKWHIEAYRADMTDGTYELLGPRIQGNPEGSLEHKFLKHSQAQKYKDVPRTFDGLGDFLALRTIEGIVFHHPDGRMGKIKKRDYGMPRK